MQAYYQAQLEQFWDTNEDEILGTLTSFHVQTLEHLQTMAWQNQITYLKQQLEHIGKGKYILNSRFRAWASVRIVFYLSIHVCSFWSLK